MVRDVFGPVLKCYLLSPAELLIEATCRDTDLGCSASLGAKSPHHIVLLLQVY
jgi:hypothetical protein